MPRNEEQNNQAKINTLEELQITRDISPNKLNDIIGSKKGPLFKLLPPVERVYQNVFRGHVFQKVRNPGEDASSEVKHIQ